MSNINRVWLLGNLGQDPEIRYTASNTPVATFSLATSEKWKDEQSGETQERTDWHRIVVFGAQAAVVGEYLNKGRRVSIEGRLQTRQWKDVEGRDRTSVEIKASNVIFLDGPRRSEPSHDPAPAPDYEDVAF